MPHYILNTEIVEMAEAAAGRSVAREVPFHTLCILLDRINDVKGKDKKKDMFSKFLKQWKLTHKSIHGDRVIKEDTFFPAMRLFLPSLDKERPSYGMKEVVLAKYYIDVLNIAKESDDARKLINYRAPSSTKNMAGDFAAVAFQVLKDRCPVHGSLSIADINACLDGMAQANVEKKRDVLKMHIQKLIRNTTALEQKWLIRIILKELKIGLNESSIFSVFHPDAMELYNVCTSLSKVCLDLHDSQSSMSEAEITLFSPFRPMLGQRSSLNEVEKLMDHQPFFIETKMDGERMQLHKRNDEYRYFSRGCNDYSDSFGMTVFRGTLTPHLAPAFALNVQSCILDGEMIAYDPNTDLFISKGENVDIKADSLDGVHPCFVVFDMLMLNDEKLANLPLKERLQKMERVLTQVPGRFQFVARKEAVSKEQVVAALNDAIDRREEGIVVKNPNSVYKPSKRKGSGWLKIKPDYIDSLMDQLDVLIIGGYFGVGRRGGMISHFLCAVAVPPQNAHNHPSIFHSFCKVGSGYSLKELKALGDTLNPHWRKFDANRLPENIMLTPGLKEKPDVLIEPSKSKIVQIKAAEITQTEKYKCGCTLRFPRVESIRDDKQWFECMDLDELKNLREVSGGHLANTNIMEDADGQPLRKRKRITKVEEERKIAEHLKGADVTSVEEESKLFEDHEFCIMSGSSNLSKHELEKKVTKHGGRFVQNPGSGTHCVIADRINVRVKNVISGGKYDVVYVSWLLSCLESGAVRKYKPQDMIFTSDKTREMFSIDYDRYGDSYVDDVTEDELKRIFKNISIEKNSVVGLDDQIANIEYRYFPNESPLGIFRRCRAYFDKWSSLGDVSKGKSTNNLDLTQLDFKFYGGRESDALDENVTHVILDKSNTTRLPLIRDIIRNRLKKAHVVTGEWVSKCIERKSLLEERIFEPI